MRLLRLLGLVAVLAFAGCGGGGGGGGGGAGSGMTTNANGCVSVAKPTASLDATKTYAVTIKTNFGSFTIMLDQKQSPHATASFVTLVNDGYFDSTKFHR